MAKLVKRVITEEYIDSRELGDLDADREEGDPEAEDGPDEDESEEQPERRRRR